MVCITWKLIIPCLLRTIKTFGNTSSRRKPGEGEVVFISGQMSTLYEEELDSCVINQTGLVKEGKASPQREYTSPFLNRSMKTSELH